MMSARNKRCKPSASEMSVRKCRVDAGRSCQRRLASMEKPLPPSAGSHLGSAHSPANTYEGLSGRLHGVRPFQESTRLKR